jgi:sugar lactone lactonase YvrE
MANRIATRFLYAVLALALGGCAGAAFQSPSNAPPLGSNRSAIHEIISPSYRVDKPLLFVAEPSNTVLIYKLADVADKSVTPIASITDALDYPNSVANDASGKIYVSNDLGGTAGIGFISEYPRGKTKHTATISDGVSYPYGVVVDSKGTLYVANHSGGSHGAGTVTEYPAGAKKPSVTISGLIWPTGLALDQSGDLYIADKYSYGSTGYSAGNIYEVPAGSNTAQNLGLEDLVSPWGVAIDAKGNIWVADWGQSQINVYSGGSKYPIKVLTAGGSDMEGISIYGNIYASDYNGGNIYAFKPTGKTPYATLSGQTGVNGLLATKL